MCISGIKSAPVDGGQRLEQNDESNVGRMKENMIRMGTTEGLLYREAVKRRERERENENGYIENRASAQHREKRRTRSAQRATQSQRFVCFDGF